VSAKNVINYDNAGGFLNSAANQTGVWTGTSTDADLLGSAGPVVIATNLGLGVVGVIFLIFIVYAGFRWLTSEGDSEKVGKAQKTIISSSIGVALIAGAFVLTNYVLVSFSNKPASGGTTSGQEDTVNRNNGCCIDRVGENLWAERMTSEFLCESMQGNDGYSGPRGTDWFFDNVSLDTQDKCLRTYNGCFDDPYVRSLINLQSCFDVGGVGYEDCVVSGGTGVFSSTFGDDNAKKNAARNCLSNKGL